MVVNNPLIRLYFLGGGLGKIPLDSHEAGFLPTQPVFFPWKLWPGVFSGGKLVVGSVDLPKFWYQKTPKRRHTYHLPSFTISTEAGPRSPINQSLLTSWRLGIRCLLQHRSGASGGRGGGRLDQPTGTSAKQRTGPWIPEDEDEDLGDD